MSNPQIVIATGQPFAVEAMVYEEDTWRLMSAGNQVRQTRESSDDLLRKAGEQESLAQGDLLVKGSRWYAIVHDIEAGSSDISQVIDRVLHSIFREVGDRQLASIGLQALGSYHGAQSGESLTRKLEVLAEQGSIPDCVERIWIQSRG